MSKLPDKFTIPKERIPRAFAQGPYSDCVAITFTKILEVFNYIRTGEYTYLSKGYMYGRNNRPDKTQGGSDYEYMLNMLKSRGSVPEEMCPERDEIPEIRKKLEKRADIGILDKEAEKHKILSWEKIVGNAYKFENIKKCLYEQQMPLAGNMTGNTQHCTVIVGYDGDKLIYQDHDVTGRLISVKHSKFNYAFYLEGESGTDVCVGDKTTPQSPCVGDRAVFVAPTLPFGDGGVFVAPTLPFGDRAVFVAPTLPFGDRAVFVAPTDYKNSPVPGTPVPGEGGIDEKEEKEMSFKLMDVGEFKKYVGSLKVTRSIKRVQLHHTYSPSYKHFSGNNHITLQQNMKTYHVNSCGWADIGQHFTIFPDGKIVTGRSMNSSPAGIANANTGGICIECLGNFDKGGDAMTEAQKNAIAGAVKILLDKFGLSAKSGVTYHAWWTNGGTNLGTYVAGKSQKTCPGTNFFGGNNREAYEKNLMPLVEEYGERAKDNPSVSGADSSLCTREPIDAGSLKAVESINDIVWELANAGIVTDGALWMKKCEEDINVYWLCRKMANKLRGTL